MDCQRKVPGNGKWQFLSWNIFWGQTVYPLWWPSLTKDMQTEQLLCWSGMTDTGHAIFSSNKEEVRLRK